MRECFTHILVALVHSGIDIPIHILSCIHICFGLLMMILKIEIFFKTVFRNCKQEAAQSVYNFNPCIVLAMVDMLCSHGPFFILVCHLQELVWGPFTTVKGIISLMGVNWVAGLRA